MDLCLYTAMAAAISSAGRHEKKGSLFHDTSCTPKSKWSISKVCVQNILSEKVWSEVFYNNCKNISAERSTSLAALESAYCGGEADAEQGTEGSVPHRQPRDSASIRAMARAHAGAEETQGQGKESGAPFHDKNTRRGI